MVARRAWLNHVVRAGAEENTREHEGRKWHIGATALAAPTKKRNQRGKCGGRRIHPLAPPRPSGLHLWAFASPLPPPPRGPLTMA